MSPVAESPREIWFRCDQCGRESYCGGEFEQLSDPDVMCPYCRHRMKLAKARVP
jgi:DNA-directed RNA polymerase subunit RPC12/RpoP